MAAMPRPQTTSNSIKNVLTRICWFLGPVTRLVAHIPIQFIVGALRRPGETCSGDCAKRLQFGIGGVPLVETVRAIACRQTVAGEWLHLSTPSSTKARRCKNSPSQTWPFFLAGSGSSAAASTAVRRHLVHEQADDRRRPDGHVDPEHWSAPDGFGRLFRRLTISTHSATIGIVPVHGALCPGLKSASAFSTEPAKRYERPRSK